MVGNRLWKVLVTEEFEQTEEVAVTNVQFLVVEVLEGCLRSNWMIDLSVIC
jgi:hypothetical protein